MVKSNLPELYSNNICPYAGLMDIGTAIMKLRETRGWTQSDLGLHLGHSGGTVVHKWESGKTKKLQKRTIQKLNEAFGLDIEEYARTEDQEQINPPRGSSVTAYREGGTGKYHLRNVTPADLDAAIAAIQDQIGLNETLLSILLMLRSEGENGLPGDSA